VDSTAWSESKGSKYSCESRDVMMLAGVDQKSQLVAVGAASEALERSRLSKLRAP
jgi:hypothetical protein